MTVITAEQARELAGPTFEETVEMQLEYAYEKIREAAENKKRRVYLTNDFWRNDGYERTKAYKAAVNELENLGFVVKFHYEELQLVNMHTIVQW